ncbi:MAG: MFS transporter [Thermoguttaceae bacterium]|nr:MFS transporter [Thermoguttaceae bacterium]MDW8037113.1 MFS transporter [Thermoguttaceae bacterium]
MAEESEQALSYRRRWGWLNRTVLGIVTATFFSDFSHELATAVLPLYLATIGLGPMGLGLMEGVADFLVSLSKLGGGVLGHYVQRKRPWATLGYLMTTIATAGIGLVRQLGGLVLFRAVAWVGRGFRGPLRDYLLADAVEPTHYGRAYGLERAGDMLGAVAGPLTAALLVFFGMPIQGIILATLLPGLVAAGAMFFLVQEKAALARPEQQEATRAGGPAGSSQPADSPPSSEQSETLRPELSQPDNRFPKLFWWFLIGVGLFGLGDFSRTFLIWLAAQALGDQSFAHEGVLSVAVLLYTWHNLVSAGAALQLGVWGDRWSKFWVLLIGYALGVGTNLLLAFQGGNLGWLAGAITLSGIYIAAEETLEKAVAAELLPRHLRSLGFGILACVNAVGDLGSSLYVGWLLEAGHGGLAFGLAAALGALGTGWLAGFGKMFFRNTSS